MIEQWQELKDTIIELRDNDGTGTQQEVCKFLVNYMGILEKQMQEPCEDEYIKVPKKALKYRTAGMVAYNAEWLKNHFDIERAVICGAQQSCEDAISRKDALLVLTGEWTELTDEIIHRFIKRIKSLPSVNPQPKTGHWIDIMVGEMPAQACDQCNTFYPLAYTGGGHNYCPNCGAKMVDVPDINDGKLSEIPTERSDKE